MSDIKRPTVNSDMIQKAVLGIVDKIDGIGVGDIISEYLHPMDGYDLAKAIERNCRLDVSREDMETLDEIELTVEDILQQAVKKWFESNDIQPPLKIGTFTTIGEITGISDHMTAYYQIKTPNQDDDNGWSRRLVKFEDAVKA